MKHQHGKKLAVLMIKQKKIDTRPHKQLDHEDPETKTLPEEEQLQYRNVEEAEINSTSHENAATRSNKDADACDEAAANGDENKDADEAAKKQLSHVRKCSRFGRHKALTSRRVWIRWME